MTISLNSNVPANNDPARARVVGNEDGLVGYWKFDDGTGTTVVDSVTASGHIAHPGTLMATSAALLPTWIESTAPIHCR